MQEIVISVETGEDSIVEGVLELFTSDDEIKLRKRRAVVGRCRAQSNTNFKFPISLKKPRVFRDPPNKEHKIEVMFNVTFCKGDILEEGRVVGEKEHMNAQVS